MRIFIYWGIYLALYNGKSEVDGITMIMVTTNFILSMRLSAVFCVNDYYLPNRIQNGSIANVLINVLSGSMIPLWFMLKWMQGVLDFTPFSSIYFTPVQIYLGQLSFCSDWRSTDTGSNIFVFSNSEHISFGNKQFERIVLLEYAEVCMISHQYLS